MEKNVLRGLAEEAGLGEFADSVYQHLRPYAFLVHAGEPTSQRLPAGAAKLGGAPDIRPGAAFDWPADAESGLPLPMVAQIPLAELKAAQPALALPATGYLYLFFHEHADTDPSVPVVCYDPDATPQNVQSVAMPENMAYDYVGDLSVAVRFEAGLDEDLAPPQDICSAGLVVEFTRLAGNLAAPTDRADSSLPSHQIGGWPESIQFFELSSGQSLLCQIDSDDALDWCWGDAGRMFFVADTEALARGDFSAVTLEIESS